MTEAAKKAPAKRSARSQVANAKPSPGGARATAQKRESEATEQDSPSGLVSETETEYGRQLREQADSNAMTQQEADKAFPPSVQELWSRVMNEVRSIEKGDYNEDQGFRFRGVDAVVNAVGPALRNHGLIVLPHKVVQNSAESYVTKRNTRMVNRVVTVTWRVYGPQQDWFEGESMGEAADAGDKSLSKSQSVAYRVFLLQALAVPTGDPDPDSEAHERAVDLPGSERVAQARRDWEASQGQNDPQRPTQPQERPTQEQRQEQAGEENQAREADVKQARTEMWRLLKPLGWQWGKLVSRFKSDHGVEPLESDPATIEAFTLALLDEAQEEERAAKALVQSELGGKPVEGEPPFPDSEPGSERLI